ncbi:MAG TPA: DNA repair protein RecO [Tepidisphaeraceae bacterium]|nr:DNA repair protein RecO [Tepidisphaeraceae bacterium]
MPLARDRCICLRKVEYSETSQILTLFAREHGIIRAIAKGAHRRTKAGASKFDGGIDLLDSGEAVFTHASEKNLGTLCEWSLRDGHREVHKHLRAMYLGQYAAELISTLIEENDPHVDLFDRFESILTELPTSRTEEAFLAFELDLFREAGYLPQLTDCVNCDQPAADRAWFSPSRGGLICRNCEGVAPDRIPIDPRLVRIAQTIMNLPRANGSPQRLPHLTRHQTDPLNKLLAEHIEHTLSRRLRLTGYVLANGR